MATCRAHKRRQALGLASLYGRKLAALEDALLAAREALFSWQGSDENSAKDQGGQGMDTTPTDEAVGAQALDHGERLLQRMAKLERDVAEMRQVGTTTRGREGQHRFSRACCCFVCAAAFCLPIPRNLVAAVEGRGGRPQHGHH